MASADLLCSACSPAPAPHAEDLLSPPLAWGEGAEGLGLASSTWISFLDMSYVIIRRGPRSYKITFLVNSVQVGPLLAVEGPPDQPAGPAHHLPTALSQSDHHSWVENIMSMELFTNRGGNNTSKRIRLPI